MMNEAAKNGTTFQSKTHTHTQILYTHIYSIFEQAKRGKSQSLASITEIIYVFYFPVRILYGQT